MLTYETLRLLKNLLFEIAKGEEIAELSRQSLAKIEDFEPYVAFQRIDRQHSDFILPRDFIEFLKDNKVNDISYEEIQYLLNFFDSDNDHKLSFAE